MTSLGLCFASDAITFDQNWHYPHSASTGGKNLPSATQIRVISSVEPEIIICSATTDGYSMVTIVCLNDAFLEFFELEASPVEDQSLQQKDKKRRNKKGEKKLKEEKQKPKDVGHFLISKF